MIISDSEKKEYEKSNICHICEKKITYVENAFYSLQQKKN